MLYAVLAAGAANVGMNVHLPPSDTLDLEVDLGAQWIRIDLNWDIAEPADGQFNWAPFDAVIDGAKSRGLKVYATMGYTPAWASTGNRNGDGNNNDVPIAAKYREFVEAAVARYMTRVDAFGTWNEPNLGDFFEGSRDEWITNVYVPAFDGIRAACPTCTIAGPEVATIGTAYPDYIAAALDARVPDILSAHIYAAFPEDDPAAGITKDSFYNKLEAHRVIGPFQGPLSIREVAVAHNQASVPIWITEVGLAAQPDDATQLEAQRKYVSRVLDAMDTRAWWAGTIFYELSEEHPGGAFPDVHFGVVLRVSDPDATPLDDFMHKPAYDYLKQRLAAAGMPDNPPPDDFPIDAGPDAGNGAGDQPGAPGGCGCRTGNPGGLVIALACAALLRRRRAILPG